MAGNMSYKPNRKPTYSWRKSADYTIFSGKRSRYRMKVDHVRMGYPVVKTMKLSELGNEPFKFFNGRSVYRISSIWKNNVVYMDVKTHVEYKIEWPVAMRTNVQAFYKR